MQVNVQEKKSQLKLTVELSTEEFQPYILEGARRIASEIKIPGFRNGKAPYNLIKAKVGEMTILEEAARVAINRTIDEAIKKGADEKMVVGQPQVDITKLAPGNPLEYKIKLTLLPKTVINQYKELNIKQKAPKIPETQINRTLDQLREANVQKTPSLEPVKMGDLVIADIHISVDKVPVEGGQGHGVNIILGKDYLVPGFDRQLLGANIGQELKFQINYPANHYQKTLAGKLVDFKVVITEVMHRRLPELDDQLAKSFGFEKLSDLKKNIAESLAAEQKKQLDHQAEAEMFEKLIKLATIEELPETLINRETEVMLDELQHNLNQNGGNLKDYLNNLKKTKEQFVLEILPQAIKRVKTALIVNEVARLEKITITAEEVDQELEQLKKHYQDNQEILKRLSTPGYKEYLANALVSNKTVRALRGWNIINEAPVEEKKPVTATKNTAKKSVAKRRTTTAKKPTK
ncbi:MAG TPA: trigger factor [bacterium]|jgi:trigger factor|nr:trigger factor [bacterium]HNZ51311.1 trigger factor [bacterium]HOH85222.1 trigger factor [bacterium]HPX64342.1 trigger factor [bacterium]HQA84335.1 trigger factor [bacterium]